MNVTGFHFGGDTITVSNGDKITENWLAFLAQQGTEGNIFYNLDYAVAQIARLSGMRESEGERLVRDGIVKIPPFELKYAPHRFLTVRHGFHHEAPFALFADASQYDKSLTVGDDTPEIIALKAIKAREIGLAVAHALDELNLSPDNLVSPISAFKKEVLDDWDLPTYDHMPREAAEYAYDCCQGNWVEAFQKGHWDTIYDYDIRSAYPSKFAKFLDLRKGKWEHTEGWLPKAVYGYCRGRVTINAPFSPVMYSVSEQDNSTPTGSWDTLPNGKPLKLTKNMIEFIDRYKLGTFEMTDGWFWTPFAIEYPYAELIDMLFRFKEKHTDMDKDICKRVMSGIYGKSLEIRRGKMGDLFNPVYGAETETRTRMQVAALCLDNNVTPIHVAVDGVAVDRPLPIQGEGLGSWKLSSQCPGLCIGSGVVALKDKYNGLDFSLNYDWLMDRIRENMEATSITMRKQSFVSVSKALQAHRWADVGKVEEMTRTIDLAYEDKRLYRENPDTGAKLLAKVYQSDPMDISMVQVKAQEADGDEIMQALVEIG